MQNRICNSNGICDGRIGNCGKAAKDAVIIKKNIHNYPVYIRTLVDVYKDYRRKFGYASDYFYSAYANKAILWNNDIPKVFDDMIIAANGGSIRTLFMCDREVFMERRQKYGLSIDEEDVFYKHLSIEPPDEDAIRAEIMARNKRLVGMCNSPICGDCLSLINPGCYISDAPGEFRKIKITISDERDIRSSIEYALKAELSERPQYKHNLNMPFIWGYVEHPEYINDNPVLKGVDSESTNMKTKIMADGDGFTCDQSSENRRLRKSKP